MKVRFNYSVSEVMEVDNKYQFIVDKFVKDETAYINTLTEEENAMWQELLNTICNANPDKDIYLIEDEKTRCVLGEF